MPEFDERRCAGTPALIVNVALDGKPHHNFENDPSASFIMKKSPKPKDVDGYIAEAPKEAQAKLKELRAIIRKTAPAAVERISYGMPYYEYKGRLAYFSFWKAHIGLYLPTPTIADHERELAAYETTKATIRFPLDRKLPGALIRKLIKARMKRNKAGKKR